MLQLTFTVLMALAEFSTLEKLYLKTIYIYIYIYIYIQSTYAMYLGFNPFTLIVVFKF